MPFSTFRQDDENGWKLRVSPEREAIEENGNWTRYTGHRDNYPGQDLYYNASTGEARHIHACSLLFFDAEYLP